MSKIVKSIMYLGLVALILIGNVIIPANTKASTDYVSVSRSVDPSVMTVNDEATVTLNIQGTPPINVVKPNDVVLLIDRSGSMGTEKMQNAKEAAKGFIDLMDLTKHQVGVLDYSSSPFQGVDLTTDGNYAKKYIDTISSGGGTGTAPAITKAKEMLANHRPEAQPVIVLMTDGDATVGGDGLSAYDYTLKMANEAKEAGIVFYTIALLDQNANPDTSGPNKLLKDMATTAQHHHFVLGSTGLADIYAAIVKEIGIASAYDLKVTDVVDPNFQIVPGSYDSNIPKPTVNGNTLIWEFKELKNNNLTFTYKITPKDKSKYGNYYVASPSSIIDYKDYAGANRVKYIPNSNIQVKLPAPSITAITESYGPPEGGNTVVITGENFLPNVKVAFGTNSSSDVQFISSQELKVLVPSGKQGKVTVKVTNPDNQFATNEYSYKANPEVSSLSPNHGPFEGGNSVLIQGKYMMPGITVKFGENSARTNIQTGDSYLSVTVPKADQSGPVDVKLINPDGTELVLAGAYTYEEQALPKIKLTSMTPNKGLLAGGEKIYLNGDLFSKDTKVYFGSIEATDVMVYSGTRIQVSAPASAQEGVVDVKVINPDGQEAVLSQAYTYEKAPALPAPSLISISLTKGLLKGGEGIYLNGTNFVSGTKVFFGDQQANVGSTYSTRIMAYVPPGKQLGPVDVRIVLPDGQEASLPQAYEYYEPAPEPVSITAMDPSVGSMKGGQTVYITGTNLKSGVKVFFNGIQAGTTTVYSPTRVSVITPASQVAGPVDVKVVNTDNGSAVLPGGYIYEAVKPTIASITPNKGLVSGGTVVYISGENFERDMTASVGGNVVPISDFISTNRIKIITPPSTAVGEVPIVLTLKSGTTAQTVFNYEEVPKLPAPIITSVTSSSGPAAGGNVIYINGSNFTSNIKVFFGDTQGMILSNYGTRLSIKVPAGVSGTTVPIKLVNTDNIASNTLNYSYN